MAKADKTARKAAPDSADKGRLQAAIDEHIAAGHSGREIERDAALATGQITKIRAGAEPDKDTYAKLAKVLGKPVWWLMGIEAPPAADAPGDIEMIEYHRICYGQPGSLNPRKTFDDEAIATLADDIFAHGLMQPVVVRINAATGAPYELIAGERRMRAIEKLMEAGRWSHGTKVAAKIVKADDTRATAMALAENIQREALNPMEEAEAFDALIKSDPELWDTASIAALIHKDIRYVQQRLAFVTKLEPTAKEALRGGLINPTQARAMTTKPKAVPSGEPYKSTAAPSAGRKANAVRRADPYPAPSAPKDYPHPKALQGVKFDFVSITTRGVDGPMPTELVLWDTRNANEARYIRADLVAMSKHDLQDLARAADDGREAVPSAAIADAAGIPPELRRPDLTVDPDDPLKIPAGFVRQAKS